MNAIDFQLEPLRRGAIISAGRIYTLRAVDIDCPLLVVPLRGRKVFAWDQSSVTVGVGQYLMLHRCLKATVQNVTQMGAYHAWAIAFPWRVIELARTLLDAHAMPPAPAAPAHAAVSTGPLAHLQDALDRLQTLPLPGEPDADGAAQDHALLGLLLALARRGDAQFRLAHDPTLAARIRLLVGARPAHDWTSCEIEQQLHMSGPTLRRRLAAEQTSLRTLVRDARLDHGLHLLQSTRKPLKAVAAACGYRSAPSFSRQFAERFGVEPGTVASRPG